MVAFMGLFVVVRGVVEAGGADRTLPDWALPDRTLPACD